MDEEEKDIRRPTVEEGYSQLQTEGEIMGQIAAARDVILPDMYTPSAGPREGDPNFRGLVSKDMVLSKLDNRSIGLIELISDEVFLLDMIHDALKEQGGHDEKGLEMLQDVSDSFKLLGETRINALRGKGGYSFEGFTRKRISMDTSSLEPKKPSGRLKRIITGG